MPVSDLSVGFPHVPRKRFGQNFLTDLGIIQKIVRAFQIQPTDHLVEIGPGRGALTRQFPPVQKLTLIEIDRDLVDQLKININQPAQFFSNGAPQEIQILCQDVLTVDFGQLSNLSNPSIRVIGNLPYYLSSDILFHVLPAIASGHIKDLLFMLQKEVVDRLIAKPDTKTYGRLSVLIQYYCTVTRLFNVPAQAFYPKPAVMSSIVLLQPKSKSELNSDLIFRLLKKITAMAFGQRRKMLRNTLHACQFTEQNWVDLNLNPMDRAENLSVSDYVKLCHWLIQKRGKDVINTI